MRFTVSLAALAATFAVASPAFAQAVTDSDSAFARGVVLGSHQLIKDKDLDFGIVAAGPTVGQVSIAASSAGTRTVSGGVSALPSTFQAAKFDGLAAPLETVSLSLTPPPGGVVQDGAGNNIPVALALDSAGSPRTADSVGGFTVYVGGTFDIAANQPAGVYSAQFQLTATYQ